MWHEPLGRALEKIAAAKPKAIGLDVTLPDRSVRRHAPRASTARSWAGSPRRARTARSSPRSPSIRAPRQPRTIHLPFLAVLREERLGISLFGARLRMA